MTAAFLATFGTALNDAENAQLGTASSDLLFLWDDNDIPWRVQLRLVTQGYKNIQILGVLADDKPGVRACIAQVIVDCTDLHSSMFQLQSGTLG
jgi:hypothetical protein